MDSSRTPGVPDQDDASGNLISQTFTENPLLSRLPPEDQVRLIAGCDVRVLRRGEVLWRRGCLTPHACLPIVGRLSVRAGLNLARRSRIVRAGDLVGVREVLVRQGQLGTVRAEEDSVVITLPGPLLRSLILGMLRRDPTVCMPASMQRVPLRGIDISPLDVASLVPRAVRVPFTTLHRLDLDVVSRSSLAAKAAFHRLVGPDDTGAGWLVTGGSRMERAAVHAMLLSLSLHAYAAPQCLSGRNRPSGAPCLSLVPTARGTTSSSDLEANSSPPAGPPVAANRLERSLKILRQTDSLMAELSHMDNEDDGARAGSAGRPSLRSVWKLGDEPPAAGAPFNRLLQSLDVLHCGLEGEQQAALSEALSNILLRWQS